MLSNDQKRLTSTAVMVVIACGIAWYFLVDHTPPKPRPQVAQQIKRPAPKIHRQPAVADSVEQPEARPLPPPVSVLKRRQVAATTQPIDLSSAKTASET